MDADNADNNTDLQINNNNSNKETQTEDNNPDSDNESAKPKRLPRSKKKQIKKLQKLENKRKKRPEVRKKHKLLKKQQREKTLSSMSPEERETYITYLRTSNYEQSLEVSRFLEKSYNDGLQICINCSFNDCMNPKEIRSLAKQISLCYSFIKKNMIPVKLILTSFNNNSPLYKDCELFGINKWKVHIYEKPFWEVFDKNDVIVLSPDATEPLEEINHDKVYIIGGLVDTNVKKFLVKNQAESQGIVCKCLPIEKYIPKCKKKVLNVSTVFEILSYKIKQHSWEEALTKCLPVRSVSE